MLKAEEMVCIQCYFGRENIKKRIELLGQSRILEICEGESAGNLASGVDSKSAMEINRIEQLEQHLHTMSGSLEWGTVDRVSLIEKMEEKEGGSECPQFPEVADDIEDSYSKFILLRKDLELRKQELVEQEELYSIATETSRYLRQLLHKDSAIVDIDFITAMVDRSIKFLVKKALRLRLRKNAHIKMIDVELSTAKEQKTIFIIYILGDYAKEVTMKTITSLNGRVLDAKRQFIAKANGADAPTAKSHGANDFKAGSAAASSATKAHGVDMNNKNADRGVLEDPDRSIPRYFYKQFRSSKRSHQDIERKYNQLKKRIARKYVEWCTVVTKERRCCETIRKLTSAENANYLTGCGWILKSDIKRLQELTCTDNSEGRFVFDKSPPSTDPPTSIRYADFVAAFQEFTYVFGVPKYNEINPGLFLIFTFPVMFGAMFGDVLHGLILLSISLALIYKFKALNHNCGIFQLILEGRYVMLCCSFAAIWFGLLYGDFGSLPISLFSSQFVVGRTYPFGIDPIWHHATNKMTFINGLKMKLSLILGYSHMSLGALISLYNALSIGDKPTFFFSALPKFIAFEVFLGYLVFLCVFKWLVTQNYPSIVNTLIEMYTNPSTLKVPIYRGQHIVQVAILILVLLCIPWMLLGKPLYLTMKKRIPKEGSLNLWIMSGIHTVEFGLGLISNTSSYLRLWAVSLAHVQLTAVLHQFTIGSSSWIVVLATFPIYVLGTLFLLIGLEGLSACLHALRLNWIEFFSKFYSGTGRLFQPLRFNLSYDEIYGK